VIGNVDPNSLVRKLNKMGKHAELWPEALNQNPPSSGGGGGGGKKNKNKKKTNNNNPTEPQKPNENSEQQQASLSDEASPEEHPEQPEQEIDNEKKPEGSAVTIIQNPIFTPNPPPNPPQITQQVGGGPGSGGKKKKKKKKNNNSSSSNNNNSNNNMNNGSNSAGNEGTESNTQEMPVNAIVSHGFVGGGAGAHLDSIGYPGGAVPHVPSFVVSYSAAQPSASFGGSYNHPHEVAPPSGTAYNGSCFYPPVVVTTVPSGAGSYYMFSEENANACVVM
jgi:hypothetical protein